MCTAWENYIDKVVHMAVRDRVTCFWTLSRDWRGVVDRGKLYLYSLLSLTGEFERLFAKIIWRTRPHLLQDVWASIMTHRQGWQRSDKVLSHVTSEWQSWVLLLLCRPLSRCQQRSESIIKVTKIFHACAVYTILPFVTYQVVIRFSYVTLVDGS